VEKDSFMGEPPFWVKVKFGKPIVAYRGIGGQWQEQNAVLVNILAYILVNTIVNILTNTFVNIIANILVNILTNIRSHAH
jgi:hypothetical protein